MVIKKLVKLTHSDPLLNQQIRHIEDTFNTVGTALQSGSLLQETTASLDQRYANIPTTDGRYISTSSFAAFSSSYAAASDGRYVFTSSFRPFSASINTFSSSVNTFTASLNAFSASVNAFSASINTFTGSADKRYAFTSSFNPFSASVNAFTASLNAFSASLATFYDKRYLLSSSAVQSVTGALTVTGTLTYTSNVTPTILSIQNTVPIASTPTCTLELSHSAGWWQFVANQLGNCGIFNKSSFKWGLYVSGNGNVGVNTVTPAEQLHVAGVVRSDSGYRCIAGVGGAASNIFNIYWTGASAQLWIDGVNTGTISTTSDRRLKQMVVSMSASTASSSLAIVSKLNPVTYRWKTQDAYVDDGIQHAGFIADEMQQVIPSAVVGQPNAVMPNGSASYQTLVPSEITPYLVRAIQEISAAHNVLALQVSALSGALTSLIKPGKS